MCERVNMVQWANDASSKLEKHRSHFICSFVQYLLVRWKVWERKKGRKKGKKMRERKINQSSKIKEKSDVLLAWRWAMTLGLWTSRTGFYICMFMHACVHVCMPACLRTCLHAFENGFLTLIITRGGILAPTYSFSVIPTKLLEIFFWNSLTFPHFVWGSRLWYQKFFCCCCCCCSCSTFSRYKAGKGSKLNNSGNNSSIITKLGTQG